MSFKEFVKIKEGIDNYSPDEVDQAEEALKHLKDALHAIRMADKIKVGNMDDWKYFASKIEEIISSDNGEAGLEPMIQKIYAGHGE